MPGHNGRWDGEVHPDRSAYELGGLRELGEVEYNQASEREAMQTIRRYGLTAVSFSNRLRSFGFSR